MSAMPPRKKSEATIDIPALVGAFRDRAWMIAVTTFLAVGLALVWLKRTPPVYVSEAILQAEAGGGAGAPDLAAEGGQGKTTVDPEELKTIEQTFASHSILAAVIEREGLANDESFAPPREEGSYTEGELVKKLRAKIHVRLVRGTRLIAVAVADHSPEKAQRFTQAIVDQFFAQRRERRQSGSESAREFLTNEVTRVGAELAASERKLEEYRAEQSAVSLEDRQNIVVDRLRDLNQQVAGAKKRRLELESRIETVRKLSAEDVDALLKIPEVAASNEVGELLSQVNQRKAELADMSGAYGPIHPNRINAANRARELALALQRALRTSADRIEQDYRSALAQEKALDEALLAQEKVALNLDRVAIPYRALEREVQANRILYEKVLERLKELDIAKEMLAVDNLANDGLRLLDTPTLPNSPSKPAPKKILALALAGGFLLGCGMIVGLHALDDSVASIDEAEEVSGFNVLTSVGRTKGQIGRQAPLVTAASASAEAEAFRSLRTSLALLEGIGDQRSVLFTSAVPGEGKTFCSLNYAAALAQQGFRTLLIDADLRRPELSRVLGVQRDATSVADVLSKPRSWRKAVVKTEIANLSLLGSPHGIRDAAGLLSKATLKQIIDLSEKSFDRIVVDAPPILAVSDALHLAQQIPVVCLVVRAHRTPKRTIARAVQLLETVARRSPAGLVLNQLRASRHAAYYTYQSDRAFNGPRSTTLKFTPEIS